MGWRLLDFLPIYNVSRFGTLPKGVGFVFRLP